MINTLYLIPYIRRLLRLLLSILRYQPPNRIQTPDPNFYNGRLEHGHHGDRVSLRIALVIFTATNAITERIDNSISSAMYKPRTLEIPRGLDANIAARLDPNALIVATGCRQDTISGGISRVIIPTKFNSVLDLR